MVGDEVAALLVDLCLVLLGREAIAIEEDVVNGATTVWIVFVRKALDKPFGFGGDGHLGVAVVLLTGGGINGPCAARVGLVGIGLGVTQDDLGCLQTCVGEGRAILGTVAGVGKARFAGHVVVQTAAFIDTVCRAQGGGVEVTRDEHGRIRAELVDDLGQQHLCLATADVVAGGIQVGVDVDILVAGGLVTETHPVADTDVLGGVDRAIVGHRRRAGHIGGVGQPEVARFDSLVLVAVVVDGTVFTVTAVGRDTLVGISGAVRGGEGGEYTAGAEGIEPVLVDLLHTDGVRHILLHELLKIAATGSPVDGLARTGTVQTEVSGTVAAVNVNIEGNDTQAAADGVLAGSDIVLVNLLVVGAPDGVVAGHGVPAGGGSDQGLPGGRGVAVVDGGQSGAALEATGTHGGHRGGDGKGVDRGAIVEGQLTDGAHRAGEGEGGQRGAARESGLADGGEVAREEDGRQSRTTGEGVVADDGDGGGDGDGSQVGFVLECAGGHGRHRQTVHGGRNGKSRAAKSGTRGQSVALIIGVQPIGHALDTGNRGGVILYRLTVAVESQSQGLVGLRSCGAVVGTVGVGIDAIGQGLYDRTVDQQFNGLQLIKIKCRQGIAVNNVSGALGGSRVDRSVDLDGHIGIGSGIGKAQAVDTTLKANRAARDLGAGRRGRQLERVIGGSGDDRRTCGGIHTGQDGAVRVMIHIALCDSTVAEGISDETQHVRIILIGGLQICQIGLDRVAVLGGDGVTGGLTCCRVIGHQGDVNGIAHALRGDPFVAEKIFPCGSIDQGGRC